MIKASIKPRSAGILAAATRGRAQKFIDKEAVVIGEAMVREVRKIVASEFRTGTPDHRKPGPHLINSFTYKLDKTSRGTKVTLTTLPGVNAKKVAALEYGVDHDYTIEPTGRITAKQNRAGLAGLRVRPVSLLRFPDPITGEDQYAPKVTHKAFEGKHMMRRARAAVVARRRTRQV